MFGDNGITQAPNDTIYVATTLGKLLGCSNARKTIQLFCRIRYPAVRLVLTFYHPPVYLKIYWSAEALLDNVAIYSDGVLWAAGYASGFAVAKHIRNPSVRAPSGAWKLGINAGPIMSVSNTRFKNITFDDRDFQNIRYDNGWYNEGTWHSPQGSGTLSSSKDLSARLTFSTVLSFSLRHLVESYLSQLFRNRPLRSITMA
ncbi:hypothetical protein PQX77_010979 [Marasmius sp. AFHP31]|nr:hypothetical protein PQX77_010979 [Marasmius sp. AFHP31]